MRVWSLQPLPSAHAHGTLIGNLAQAGYCLSMCMNYISMHMFCEHVLLIDDHACYPHYPMIVTLNILVRHRVMNDGIPTSTHAMNLIQ